MVILSGQDGEAEDVLNSKTYNNDVRVGPGDTHKLYVHIDNGTGVRNIFLYLYGDKSAPEGAGTGFVGQHDHSTHTHTHNGKWAGGGSVPGSTATTQVGTSGAVTPIDEASVPQAVEIWIDGSQYTATIGDPNSKGATMYDSGNDDWGVDGTTVWNTGELDITDIISWTAGEHYIEFKETGSTGGRLQYNLYINFWS